MTHEQTPIQALAYQAPIPPRRWRVLPPSVAIAVVICGTLLAGTPCVVAGCYVGGIPDYVMGLCWVTAAAGFIVMLLGIFLAAPQRRSRSMPPAWRATSPGQG